MHSRRPSLPLAKPTRLCGPMAAKEDKYVRPLITSDPDAALHVRNGSGGGGGQQESNADIRVPWYRALPLLVKGDVDAFIVVFSNNLASVLIAVGLIQGKIGVDRTYNYVVPGIALSMLFGCVFYAIQAQLKSASTGRQNLCAQPFGINTPGIFAFAFSIIFPVYAGAGGGDSPDGPTEEAAQKLAWRVGVLANFVQGTIEIILSVVGPRISGAVPIVALLGSLASIGLTFLFTNAFQGEVFAPVVGFVPFYMILMAIYSNVKLPRLPAMLLPVLVSVAAAWIMRRPGIASAEAVKESVKLLGWHPCLPTFEAFEDFGEVAGYLPVVFPVALTVSMGTIQCREVAAKAGDPYNLRASMLGDGLATVVAALFGSPFGMTVFIGHPGYKMMGAKVGYNFLCGLGFVVVCFSGMAGLFKALFPTQSLNPILLFIGLAICSDALEVTPPRHWPALMLALVPCFCNWATTQAMNFAVGICKKEPKGCTLSPNSPGAWTVDATGDLRGLYALGQGYLLTSIYLSAMLIFTIDRAFAQAALWAFVAALSASVGLIHADMLFLPWRGPTAPSGIYNPDQFDLHWDFTVAYLLLCAMFLFCAFLQSRGLIPRGPVKLAGAEAARSSFSEDGGLLQNRERV
mmetsp:Transcript_47231/g.109260  ORF Transcript_47231/g.109260 Transcript_47231/m.109260 type:complete len:631 (-) Transcript_47231:64-1956(-)